MKVDSPDPELRRVALGLLARISLGLTILLAALIGTTMVDFIPAPFYARWHGPTLLIAMGTVAAWVWVSPRMARHGAGYDMPHGRIRDAGIIRLVEWLLVPLLCGGLMWMTLGTTVPWLVTRIAGEPYRQVSMMRTQLWPASRACNHRLVGDVLERVPRGYLCIDKATYLRYPDQDVEVSWVSRRSPLGDAVLSAEIIRQRDPAAVR